MKRTIITLLGITLLLLPAAVRAEDGSTGLAFLKLGVGARPIGLGDAYVGVSGDVSSIYWNPAGLAQVEHIDLMFQHSEWFQGIRYEFLGGAQRFEHQAFGIGLTGLYMDDLERREGPTSEPIGHFGVFDFALTGSYARTLTDYLDVGASVKYLHEKIDNETASGFAVDLGATYRVPSLERLSIGAVVQNLGTQMKYLEDKFDIPLNFRTGLAYSIPAEQLKGEFLAVTDLVVPGDGKTKLHIGLEYMYARVFALRFGYRTGWDNQNVSVGLGANVESFRLDYAYTPFYSDLGDTHRFSLAYAF
jgi:hypothetical protein